MPTYLDRASPFYIVISAYPHYLKDALSALMKTVLYPLTFSYSIVQEIVRGNTIDVTINKQQLRQHLAVV